MSIPIIYIHKGHGDYLEYSLLQARRTNPHSRLILLGDAHKNRFAFAEHYNLSGCWRAAAKFESIYRHLSLNSHEFELFCIQRWFILEEFLTASNLGQAYYQDSDVMLYADISEEQRRWVKHGLAFAGSSGHSTFINSLDALRYFCAFIRKHYTDANLLHELESTFDEYKRQFKSGGICDMTLFHRYRLTCSAGSGDLLRVCSRTTYDDNFNDPAGYISFFGKKKIYVRKNRIFCRDVASKRFIRFNTLHFQYKAKGLMKFASERRWFAFHGFIVLQFCWDRMLRAAIFALRPLARLIRGHMRR